MNLTNVQAGGCGYEKNLLGCEIVAGNSDNTKRVSIKFQVRPDARVVLESIREDTGVPQTEALSRVLEWFAGLDVKLRLAILNRDVETRRELLRLAIEKMLATRDPVGAVTEMVKPPANGQKPSGGAAGPHGQSPDAETPRGRKK